MPSAAALVVGDHDVLQSSDPPREGLTDLAGAMATTPCSMAAAVLCLSDPRLKARDSGSTEVDQREPSRLIPAHSSLIRKRSSSGSAPWRRIIGLFTDLSTTI